MPINLKRTENKFASPSNDEKIFFISYAILQLRAILLGTFLRASKLSHDVYARDAECNKTSSARRRPPNCNNGEFVMQRFQDFLSYDGNTVYEYLLAKPRRNRGTDLPHCSILRTYAQFNTRTRTRRGRRDVLYNGNKLFLVFGRFRRWTWAFGTLIEI